MSSEWIEHKLSDLATFKYGKFLAKSALSAEGFPVYSGYGVVGYLPDYHFEDSQLLIVCRGEGGTGDVKMSPKKCSITNLSIVISPKEQLVSRKFLYWALKASDTRRLRTGSAQAQIVIAALENLPISIPLGSEIQSSVVEFLDSLDDRITLLRETNITLESIAQAIFKSWFVDFDPVRAKMNGLAPEGMDEEVAGLFPNGFEESELGDIPRGWHIDGLHNILLMRNERTQPSEATKALPYVPVDSITAKSPFLMDFKSGEDANSSLILFHKGDILFGAMRPYFHKVCIAPFDGVTRTTVFTLMPRIANAREFALFLAFQDATIEYAAQHSEGSTIPYAKWRNSLENMPTVIPSEVLQERYSNIVAPLIDKANQNNALIHNLSELRDVLLPRLISGQLQIPEAEAIA